MKNNKINFKILAKKSNISESKLRKISKNEPDSFRDICNLYYNVPTPDDIEIDIVDIDGEENNDELQLSSKTKLYAMFSLKGGCGKSTLGDMMGNYLTEIEKEKAVIFNLDSAQIASNINSCKTIDYVTIQKDYTVLEALVNLSKIYDHIIIDTPGEISEEFLKIIHLIHNFILPFNPGPRNITTAVTTLKVYLGKESQFLKGHINIYAILNNYSNNIVPIEEVKELNRQIKEIDFSDDIELNIKYTGVKHSKTIKTIEESGKSINQLYKETPGAYSNPKRKTNEMCKKIFEIFNQE